MNQPLGELFLKVRKEFPMLSRLVHGKPFVYLDSAATTHKPSCVIDAMSSFYKEQYGTVHRAIYTTAQEADTAFHKARETIAAFFNANSSREIIFTRGTTDSLNILASSFSQSILRPHTTVLISEMEHHSNIVPWQMACSLSGATLVVIPVLDSGELDLEAYEKLLKKHTVSVVSVPHISNILGTCNPISYIATRAHEHGAIVVVDGAQSALHMPIDLQNLGCDFFACSGHKIIGPTGIGVLWGKLELLEKMPPSRGGGDMIDTVTFEKTTYNTPPLKFEPGTPMIAEAIGLGEAIRYVEKIGFQAIMKWEQHLFNKLFAGIQEIPSLRILGTAQERGTLVTFVVDGVHPLDIATLLDLHGIAVRSGHLCGQPILHRFGCTSATRASLCFYNSEEDIDQFLRALQKVIEKLIRL